MTETDPEATLYEVSSDVVEETTTAGTNTAEAIPAELTPTPVGVPEDDDGYLETVNEALTDDWERPGRDSRTPNRSGVVNVQLSSEGDIAEWRWRRRSAQTRFNESVSNHLDRLMEEGVQFPLPAQGSQIHQTVLTDGISVEFADIEE